MVIADNYIDTCKLRKHGANIQRVINYDCLENLLFVPSMLFDYSCHKTFLMLTSLCTLKNCLHLYENRSHLLPSSLAVMWYPCICMRTEV